MGREGGEGGEGVQNVGQIEFREFLADTVDLVENGGDSGLLVGLRFGVTQCRLEDVVIFSLAASDEADFVFRVESTGSTGYLTDLLGGNGDY